MMKFYSFDLELDPMTLILQLNLDIVKMYLCIQNKVPSFSSSKVVHCSMNRYTDKKAQRHIDRHTQKLDRNYYRPTYIYVNGKNVSILDFDRFS